MLHCFSVLLVLSGADLIQLFRVKSDSEQLKFQLTTPDYLLWAYSKHSIYWGGVIKVVLLLKMPWHLLQKSAKIFDSTLLRTVLKRTRSVLNQVRPWIYYCLVISWRSVLLVEQTRVPVAISPAFGKFLTDLHIQWWEGRGLCVLITFATEAQNERRRSA